MIAPAALGLAIGLAVGSIGGGGSVLAVPALVYLLSQSVQQATTTSLVVVAAGAAAGAVSHARHAGVCWRQAAWFTTGAIPGILAGTASGQLVSGRLLLGAFAVLMLGAARATWRKAPAGAAGEASPERCACPALRLARSVLTGCTIGFLTGFFGVGGGFVIVPALVLILGFPMRAAVGTSLVIIAATSALGIATHVAAGHPAEPAVAAAMGAACVLGALIGANRARRLPQRAIGRGFALALVALAGYLLLSVTALGATAG